MLTEAMTAPLFAPLADRYGRRPMFLICVFFWGIGAGLFGFVGNVYLTVLARGFRELQKGQTIERQRKKRT